MPEIPDYDVILPIDVEREAVCPDCGRLYHDLCGTTGVALGCGCQCHNAGDAAEAAGQ